MKDVFIQIIQVWAHYFKLFNRVQSTQDEKARFIKGNKLKLSYFRSFILREHIPMYKDIRVFRISYNNCLWCLAF